MTYTARIEYDEQLDDYILPLPDVLITQLNWRPGDSIEWIDNKDGTWTICKKEKENA